MADLPDPEQIEVGGSFARFMANNVDPAAKTAALRALWKQPHFNEIDGLLEYALDYSNQPKLSPEVSAELAKKIFRHIVKEEPEESLDEMDMAQATAVEALAPEITEVKHEQTEMVSNLTSDNLDGQSDELPQNEPELTTNVHCPVV